MLILDGGARRELELPLAQLDQIAVSLLDVAERGRLAGAQQGYAHDLKPAEMTTGFPASGGFRLMALPRLIMWVSKCAFRAQASCSPLRLNRPSIFRASSRDPFQELEAYRRRPS